MHYVSHPAASLSQPDDTVYKLRLNKGWLLVLAYQCLVMALPTLKLLHIAGIGEWSWLLVTLPVWGPSVLLAVVLGAEQAVRLSKAKASESMHSLVMEPSVASY